MSEIARQPEAAMRQQQKRLDDAFRADPRTPGRGDEYVRERPREAHEKFDLPRGSAARGMSYVWAALRIPYTTLRSPRLSNYVRSGWHFCRAEDHPEHSGYRPGSVVNERWVKLGIEEEVHADDPVIRDGMVLMQRPKALTEEAEAEQQQAATRQITEHLQQQRQRSEREIGSSRTVMRNTYGPPDEAPSDHDAEI